MMLGIIPARYASTRFPGKPLADIQGKPMIQRVYEQAIQSARLGRVVVATDDRRIYDTVLGFGGEAFFTRAEHPSGTDRCAELARRFPEYPWVINIQGDEPFIQPEQIDLLADTLLESTRCSIATLVKSIEEPALLDNPNVVKVVFSNRREALYFSRQAIPYQRNAAGAQWTERHTYYKHIGLYGFRRSALLRLAKLAPSGLELSESLEQLRWLENGFRIAVGITEFETQGIDTPDDLHRLGIK